MGIVGGLKLWRMCVRWVNRGRVSCGLNIHTKIFEDREEFCGLNYMYV